MPTRPIPRRWITADDPEPPADLPMPVPHPPPTADSVHVTAIIRCLWKPYYATSRPDLHDGAMSPQQARGIRDHEMLPRVLATMRGYEQYHWETRGLRLSTQGQRLQLSGTPDAHARGPGLLLEYKSTMAFRIDDSPLLDQYIEQIAIYMDLARKNGWAISAGLLLVRHAQGDPRFRYEMYYPDAGHIADARASFYARLKSYVCGEQEAWEPRTPTECVSCPYSKICKWLDLAAVQAAALLPARLADLEEPRRKWVRDVAKPLGLAAYDAHLRKWVAT